MEGSKIRYWFCSTETLFDQEISSGYYPTTASCQLKEKTHKRLTLQEKSVLPKIPDICDEIQSFKRMQILGWLLKRIGSV